MKQLFLTLTMLALPLIGFAQQRIDLSGNWTVSLGGNENHSIVLPNTLDGASIGEPNALSPALTKPQLSRLTRKHSFIGEAKYQREITITKEMADKPLELFLERVMWRSRLLIDGQDAGQMQESLVTPHVFHIKGLTEGKHTLTLIIDNRKLHEISVDNLAHSYTNDTQIMWNGVLGRMELNVAPVITDVQVYPDIEKQQVSIKVKGSAADYVFTLDGCNVVPTKVGDGEYVLPISNMKLWDEFTPNLYTLTVSALQSLPQPKSKRQTVSHLSPLTSHFSVSFGMRSFKAKGNRLLINGNPTFLRGTLECCIFPLTGTPPTDERGWMKVFTTAREYGLNHLRFHSWCPPEAAFRVADKMGFYCQVELPNWSLKVNQDSATAKFLYQEFDNIIRNYGNHPSLCIISCGNELQPDFKFLNEFTHYMKTQDPRHLYVTSTFTFEKGHGVKQEPEDDIFITQWTDNGWVRGQGVFDEKVPDFKSDYREAAKNITVPLISHEIGQYSVYPNINEIDKYSGVLDPLNFKAIRNDLQKKGLLHKADDYLKASGKLAAILYKEEMERAMKTPQQSGFQLLDLHDFPGQGTALVGLLDAFWDSKGLVEPQRFREACAPVVPLAQFDKAVWKADETFTARVDIANYSLESMEGKTICWQLSDEMGDIYAEGSGKNISIVLNKVSIAKRFELIVSIKDTPWRNRWNIWVYPDVVMPQDKKILVTSNIDEALKALNKGKKVLFSPKKETVKGLEGKFLPVFWSPVHFPKQAGTMGLLCDPRHPALAHFPTDMHSDWQWWNLVKRSRVMVLDSIAPVSPIVESVDNFVNNRRLAKIFEAKVGKGSLIFSSIDLLTDSNLPEIRQMQYSLLKYMQGSEFHPSSEISVPQLRSLLLNEATEQNTGATSIYD
ncbi:MAG: glycoside hydrolase family 2 [Prevotella sp.]|nr:glycoside hydrolase family 2 [Prevotella sp.]